MEWCVVAYDGVSDSANEIHDSRHESVELAKAQVFDLITKAGNCSIKYHRYAVYEEFVVTDSDGDVFVVWITGNI